MNMVIGVVACDGFPGIRSCVEGSGNIMSMTAVACSHQLGMGRGIDGIAWHCMGKGMGMCVLGNEV